MKACTGGCTDFPMRRSVAALAGDGRDLDEIFLPRPRAVC